MLHPPVVPVHRHPVFQRLPAGQSLLVVRICVTEKIPGRPRPLRHGVRLPPGRAAAAGAGGIHPVLHGRQRRFPVVGRFIALHLRKHQGQFAVVHRHKSALLTLYNGNWLPPVALPGKYPVPELIVGLAVTDSLLLQERDNPLLRLRHGESVQKLRIHKSPRGHICVHRLLDAHRAARHHLNNGQAKLFGKFPVPLIMGRDGHNGPCAVSHQHIVGHPDGDLPAVYRIGGGKTFDLDPRLLLCQLRALEI